MGSLPKKGSIPGEDNDLRIEFWVSKGGLDNLKKVLDPSETTGSGDLVSSVSPDLTGTPTVPTASLGTSTTQIASTEFVQDEIVDADIVSPSTAFLVVSDETTALTTGTNQLEFVCPDNYSITSLKASVTTAPTGANLVVDINTNGTSILGTKLSIDAGEKTSTTAATPHTYAKQYLSKGDKVTIDIDQVGSTVAGAGLKVVIGLEPTSAFGQEIFDSPGTYSWTCPAGVTSVSVVCVGAGGSGGSEPFSSVSGPGGGGLGYKNNISVTPGNSYTVVVGESADRTFVGGQTREGGDGGNSYFIDTSTVCGFGGGGGNVSGTSAAGGTYAGDGGGNGGAGGAATMGGTVYVGGGGGAGGYSGNGGAGGSGTGDGSAGSGGGGGGAAPHLNSHDSLASLNAVQHGGGGVGIFGEGSSGSGGTFSGDKWGLGGSGGTDGSFNPRNGGTYGGGGYSYADLAVSGVEYAKGGKGVVRIIWGSGRSFPSTNVF